MNSDEENLYILNEYYFAYDFPEGIDINQLDTIPLKQIRKIKIKEQLFFSTKASTAGNYMSHYKSNKFGTAFIKFLGYSFMTGLGIDMLTGLITIAPVFTTIGGVVGLVGGLISGASASIGASNTHFLTFYKYHIVKSNKINLKIRLDDGFTSTEAAQLNNYLYMQLQ